MVVVFSWTWFYNSILQTNIKFRANIHVQATRIYKYLPLEEWFRKQPATKKQIKLTFDQVEAILGAPLPKSATKLKTWWTNVQPKIQSHRTAWLNNGWTVTEFDQQAGWVKFLRA